MNKLTQLLDFLSGKKTYIVAFVMATLNLLVALGLISVDSLEQINVFLGSLGLATVRAGIKKA